MNRSARTSLAAVAGLIALSAASARAQGTGNDLCVLKLSNDARMVLHAEHKKNRNCIGSSSGDVTPCVDIIGAHTATLQAKLLADDLNLCAAVPAFAYGGGTRAAGAARDAANAITHDLFGTIIRTATTPNSVRCQEHVSRAAGKLAAQRWADFWKCQNRSVADCPDGTELATLCLGGPSGPQPDSQGHLAMRQQMLADKSQRWCADAGVPFSVFNGACGGASSATTFTNCLSARVDCRVCHALQGTHALGAADLDCDQFDDGSANASCDADCRDGCDRCGDGIMQAARSEECDDGNRANGDGCSAGCIIEHCGDGHLDAGRGEQCDDGANENGDGCSAGCRIEPCDGDACPVVPRNVADCGNGSVQHARGEACDDGNARDHDGCSAFCQVEYCGDGYRQPNEECDPGFGAPGCSAECEIEYCGDAIIQESLDEQCDDGNDDPNDGCSHCVSSSAATTCGNGIVDAGEECDDGAFNGYGMCHIDCRRCSAAEVEAPAAVPVRKNQITDLQHTGLFQDAKDPAQGLEPGIRLFEPQYALWSDAGPAQGGMKARWIFLPQCKQIDNRVQDRWEFPVGTKVWKEFKLEGKRIETRMMQKVAAPASPDSWEYLAFRWVYDARTGAVVRVEKVPDSGAQEGDPGIAAGELQVLRRTLTVPRFSQATIDLAIGRGPDANWIGGPKRIDRADAGHKIPALWECEFCHSRGGDVVLAFDYLQLSTDRDPGAPNSKDGPDDPFAGLRHIDLDTLKQQRLVTQYQQLITNPRIAARGDGDSAATERAMLGYLHGNCGHCHNPQGAASFTGLRMRFDTTKNTAGAHDAITTPVIERGRPHETKIYKRMLSRHEYRQMPPIGTNVQDAEALELLARWINTMPPTP